MRESTVVTGTLTGTLKMTHGNSTTPWQKIWKFITNPTVEVIAAIVVVLASAYIVIETEASASRKNNPFPILFGHK